MWFSFKVVAVSVPGIAPVMKLKLRINVFGWFKLFGTVPVKKL